MTRLSRLFGVSSLFASCAAPTVGKNADPAVQARAHLDALVASGELPGFQYRVLGRGGVVFAADGGVRDAAGGAPMTAATLQMAYSTTKVITAIAVLQLVERGRLALDGPLSAVYPAHPYGDAVTIRHLLAHTSGAPNPMPLDWFVLEGEPLDRDARLAKVLADHPRLSHPAGQAYGYSNVSYWLLEKAIESASGQDYAAYVQEHVFAPLSISSRAARFELGAAADLAVGHSPRWSPLTWLLRAMTPRVYWRPPAGGWRPSARVTPQGRGYGGLFASAAALAAVMQDLLQPESRLLSAASKAAMFSQQTTGAGEPIAGTLGWVIGDLAGARYFGKQGGGLGFHANLRLYPERGLATVLLANRTEISAGRVDSRSDRLDAIFLGRAP